ncbi:Hypp2029 [Branchiostoma lanceolatum]|uniref:Hypp2029 protein n=1 Tax=Branchiostoma lanceolatum TaxID=7740 RepID=A0A8K0ENJ0_BRALA|nr:Hypp2029 [Branchiostoma lanceolatum]
MDNNLFFAIKVYFGEPRLREPEITDEPGSLYNYVMSVTLTLTLALLLGLLVHVTVRRLTWCPPLKFTREQGQLHGRAHAFLKRPLGSPGSPPKPQPELHAVLPSGQRRNHHGNGSGRDCAQEAGRGPAAFRRKETFLEDHR